MFSCHPKVTPVMGNPDVKSRLARQQGRRCYPCMWHVPHRYFVLSLFIDFSGAFQKMGKLPNFKHIAILSEWNWKYMGVSENSGTPKSSHLNRVFHYFHHPFWGTTIFGNTHIKSHMFLTTIVPFSPDFEKAAMILASLMAVDGKKQKSGENSPVEVGSKKNIIYKV